MEVSLSLVEELSPDQASLTAAKKLLSPAKWPVLELSEQMNLIWGECQGSGSKPYYTTADTKDHGYKCTCPSRKFPCKHVLALLWKFSDVPDDFSEAPTPQWVNDWLGRRRKKTTNDEATDASTTDSKASSAPKASLEKAQDEQLTEQELAKIEADKAKRALQNKEKTKASVTQGILELQQWINDQLNQGLITFLKESSQRCKQISVRLVDAKAANLAARLDEFPAKLMARPISEQSTLALREFSKLALLSEAWLTNPDDIDVYRSVVTSEKREQVIATEANLGDDVANSHSKFGLWLVIGEKSEMKKNGLLANYRWLLYLPEKDWPEKDLPEKHLSEKSSESGNTKPTVALLLDYVPVQSGASKQLVQSLGKALSGKVTFYPSRLPERAILGEHEYLPVSEKKNIETYKNNLFTNVNNTKWHDQFMQQQQRLPWLENYIFIGGKGCVAQDQSGRYWWKSDDQSEHLPLINDDLPTLVLSSSLTMAFILLDGQYGELISVEAQYWGMISCQ